MQAMAPCKPPTARGSEEFCCLFEAPNCDILGKKCQIRALWVKRGGGYFTHDFTLKVP